MKPETLQLMAEMEISKVALRDIVRDTEDFATKDFWIIITYNFIHKVIDSGTMTSFEYTHPEYRVFWWDSNTTVAFATKRELTADEIVQKLHELVQKREGKKDD